MRYLEKLIEVFCTNGCKRCCDCCFETEKKEKRIEIRHSFRDSILDSTSSNAESLRSFRERHDSENSRTDSVSSTGTPDYKRYHTTPIIDMKPIEFWTANRENVQPKTKRRLPSESEISIDNFQRDLYDNLPEETPCLTDEEKLAQYQLGQIHFGLQYEVSSKTLVVKIIEAKDLPPPYCLDENKQDMSHSNPYCKISLLPDQKNSQQTTVQRKTQEPMWNEYFSFEIPYKEVQMRTLEILVKDFDKFSRHCVIGQIYLPLNSVNLIKGGHMWKPLIPGSPERQDLGEILLSLNYLPSAGRLNVDIIKGKQLQQTEIVGGADPLVKVTLIHFEKPIKTKKTSIKKSTIDPIFNESISFNITPQQLENTSLVISVWHHGTKSKDEFVGRIVLGRYGTGPHEFTHWSRMLQCQRSPVAQWHSLRLRAECDQVSPASIAVQ
ncbi:synaptotagmin 17 [Lottia gigantea]|uniref:Synaptotagmin-17 n=1 Tax=Lottia gigantea TaxID=225164 RepID=V3ZXX9_LOTGI|nr:synaptotagmin 17 [Lottia gigantea]ESO87480.1 synaptotagmin 17 [Lottia gigantea]